MRLSIVLLSSLLAVSASGCDDEPPSPPGPLEPRILGNTILEHPDLEIVISGVADDEHQPVLFGTEQLSLKFAGLPFDQSSIASTTIEWSSSKRRPGNYGRLSREPTLDAALLEPGLQKITATVFKRDPRSSFPSLLYLKQRTVRVQRAETTPSSISLRIDRNGPGAHIDRVYLEGVARDSTGNPLPHDAMIWLYDPHGSRQEIGRGAVLYVALGEGTHEIGLQAHAPGHSDALAWISVDVVHTVPPAPAPSPSSAPARGAAGALSGR